MCSEWGSSRAHLLGAETRRMAWKKPFTSKVRTRCQRRGGDPEAQACPRPQRPGPHGAAALVPGDTAVQKPVFCCFASLARRKVWATSSASNARNPSTSLRRQSGSQRGRRGGPRRSPEPPPAPPRPARRLLPRAPALPPEAGRWLPGPKQLCLPKTQFQIHATRPPTAAQSCRVWGCTPSPPRSGAPSLPPLRARDSYPKPGTGRRARGRPTPPGTHLRPGRQAGPAPAPAPAGGSSAPPCGPRAAAGRRASPVGQ